jgi:hypothetical protein
MNEASQTIWKNTKTKLFGLIINTIVVLIILVPALAQEEKVVKCKVKTKELKSVKYYVGQVMRVENTLSIHIAVKTNQINETDLVLIARNIKERYCNETEIVVGIFDKKVTADRFDTSFKSAIDALRGEYVLDKAKGEDYISFVKIPDYYNNPKERIKIDLKARDNPR